MRANMRADGVVEARAAFRRVPREAKASLKQRTRELTEVLAESARKAGAASDAQSALVAPLVKAGAGFVAGGGSKLVGRNSVPAYKIIFGAEFGSNNLAQFRPHRSKGYWLNPTVERERAKITASARDVADDVIRGFTRGGA